MILSQKGPIEGFFSQTSLFFQFNINWFEWMSGWRRVSSHECILDYLIWLINSNYINYIYQNASVGRKSSSRQNVGARTSVGGGNIPTSQFAHPDTEKEKTKCSKFEHLLRKESRMGNLNLKAFLFYFLIQTLCPDNFWISNFSLFMWTFGKV